mmetsp:Transcript_9986/g.21337  ORF Transcript_9986/g.21337 Transcript_9986/m.21337 type:complete len:336 (-) Transcript_9986:83-1090(-)
MNCTGCSRQFNTIHRRHHCRLCGCIFCGSCSRQKLLLPESFRSQEPQRVCNTCAGVLGGNQAQYASTMANCHKTNDLGDDRVRSKVPNAMRPYMNNPFAFTLGSEIRKAAFTLRNMMDPLLVPDSSVPEKVIRSAQGFAFLSVLRVGFLFAGRAGSGVVVVRRDDGSWSAPSALGALGFGGGFQIGADVTDYCLILTNRSAVRTFASKAQISLGGEIGLSVGPVGRNGQASVNAGDKGLAPVYSYSHSRGLFAGVDLTCTGLISRGDVNQKFYGQRFSPEQILLGTVPQPQAGSPLYEALGRVFDPTGQTAAPAASAPPAYRPASRSKGHDTDYE